MAPPSRPAPQHAPDPVLETLRTAPFDDEPYTDEERQADEAAREAARQGRVVTTEELRRRLGL